jgi:hypothetical protein
MSLIVMTRDQGGCCSHNGQSSTTQLGKARRECVRRSSDREANRRGWRVDCGDGAEVRYVPVG